jgi:Atypical PilZ domain, cyclic di-GMP receptor
MTDTDTAYDPLFADTLACDETRPAAFVPGPADDAQVRAHLERSEGLLRALGVVEDSGRNEEPESPADNFLQRIEAKLDLLVTLMAASARGRDGDPPRALSWSARGARLEVDTPLPAETPGLFRLQPAEWLPSALILPATVQACEARAAGGFEAWLRFGPLPPALEAALERHIFRVHRRAVAESRRAR